MCLTSANHFSYDGVHPEDNHPPLEAILFQTKRSLLSCVSAFALSWVGLTSRANAQQGNGFPSSSAAFADFNGDGKLDVVCVSVPDSLVALGNGDGTFTKSAVLHTPNGTGCWSIVAGDFNGDGKADIVEQCIPLNAYLLFAGNGDGTFQSPVSFSAPPRAASVMTVFDATGQGRKNILAAGFNLDGSPNVPTLALLNNNGKGVFTTGQTSTPGTINAVAIGDVTGDHYPDIVFMLANNNIAVLPVSNMGRLEFPAMQSKMIMGMNALALASLVQNSFSPISFWTG